MGQIRALPPFGPLPRKNAARRGNVRRFSARPGQAPAPDPAEAELVPERSLPAPAEVAHNSAVEERIAQIEDPAARERAEELLATIRSEVEAEEQARERRRAHALERGRDRGEDFDLEP